MMKTIDRMTMAMVQAAMAAGEELSHKQKSVHLLTVQEKKIGDFVSQADWEAERGIRRRLMPLGSVLGEEDGLTKTSESDGLFVIDPLDGTTNFLSGRQEWCISIGWVVDGKPMMGVIHAPMLGLTFVRDADGRVLENNRDIRVSQTSHLDRALISCVFPYASSTEIERKSAFSTMSSISEKVAGLRCTGSAALDLAYVASGRSDGFLASHGLKAWDVAAGMALIEGAGGRTYSPGCESLDLWSGEFAADNHNIDILDIMEGQPNTERIGFHERG